MPNGAIHKITLGNPIPAFFRLPAQPETQAQGAAAAAPLGAPISYDEKQHGKMADFPESPEFATLKREYKNDFQSMSALADQHLPANHAHQLKAKLDAFEFRLFDNPTFFSTNLDYLFSETKAQFHELVQMLDKDNLSNLSKIEALETALGEIDKCADGVMSNIATAYTNTKFVLLGIAGDLAKLRSDIVTAEAKEFATMRHGKTRHWADNEIHYVNDYIAKVADEMGIVPPNDRTHMRPERHLLDQFTRQIAATVTPMLLARTLVDNHVEAYRTVLADHNIKETEKYLEEDLFPVMEEMDTKVTHPLRPIVGRDDYATVYLLTRDKDSPSVDLLTPDEDYASFANAALTLRKDITSGLAAILSDNKSKPEPFEQIINSKGAQIIMHLGGIDYWVTDVENEYTWTVSNDTQDTPDDPSVTDLVREEDKASSAGQRKLLTTSHLENLDLKTWPPNVIFDLCLQAIEQTSDVSELLKFVSSHPTFVFDAAPLQPGGLPSLTHRELQPKVQAMITNKMFTNPNMRAQLTTWLSAVTKDEFPLLKLLTQFKTGHANKAEFRAAYLTKMVEFDEPLETPLIKQLLSDFEAVSRITSQEVISKYQAIQPVLFRAHLDKAVKTGDMGVCNLLLPTVVDINQPNRAYETLLLSAVMDNQNAIVDVLLAYPKIDPNQTTTAGSPLRKAVAQNNLGMVKALLAHPGINPNHSHHSDIVDINTPLITAARLGYTDVAKALLAHQKIDLGQNDFGDKDALHYAAEAGHVDVVALLLDQPKINVHYKKIGGQTPIYHAYEARHFNVVALIEAHIAELEFQLRVRTALDRMSS